MGLTHLLREASLFWGDTEGVDRQRSIFAYFKMILLIGSDQTCVIKVSITCPSCLVHVIEDLTFQKARASGRGSPEFKF